MDKSLDKNAHYNYLSIVETCDTLIDRTEWVLLRAMIQQSKIYIAADDKEKGRGGGKKRTNDEGQ